MEKWKVVWRKNQTYSEYNDKPFGSTFSQYYTRNFTFQFMKNLSATTRKTWKQFCRKHNKILFADKVVIITEIKKFIPRSTW